MNPMVPTALRSFSDRVQDAYGDAFISMILYGSQARGEATEDSDIDFAVILKTVDDSRAVRDRLAEIAYDVLLETGEDIRAIAIDQDQWEYPERFTNPMLIRSMKRDGIALDGR